ncbi:hypothetical protein C6501_19215 [Candidatus Poribacteria bacterium]|nr:MAG: hypothetical protein C6501_19215 [Candidatus Poribacteria bacterium]
MLKRLNIILILLFAFSFSGTLLADESANKYFPSALGSFWVYEDQDGNELTRKAIEGEEIAGKTYPAFSYEPELEDWAEYSWFIRPPLYQVSNAGITLVVSDEVEKAVKARLKKEVGILTDAIKRDAPVDVGIDADIKVQGQNQLFLLPDTITFNEEWDVNQIEANVKMKFLGGGAPEDQPLVIDFTILETAIISGTETVETPAGKFEDCLKVEYRTETTAAMTPAPPPDEVDPPGETVTTVWYAPNVGIVQFRQETNYIFLEMIPDDEDLPVPPGPKTKTFKLKRYEIKSGNFEGVEKKSITTPKPLKDDTEKGKTKTSNAQSPNYFPGTLDSFWIYEDQDGNELTRHAIEGEEIAGKTYPAFSYEPELEDWTKYSPFIRPSLYQVSEVGLTLVVSDEVKKAVKARLKKEIDTFVQTANAEAGGPDYDWNVEIEVKIKDNLLLLPDAINVNEEWDANQIKANVKLTDIIDDVPDEDDPFYLDFTIVETGIVLGMETIETPAGIFEDCLKVEYRTETTVVFDPHEDADPPGETVTTVWFAPNVGIVKLHQKVKYIFLELIPDDADFPMPPDPKPKTFELKKYEIKSADTESSKSNSKAAVKSAEDKVETKKAKPSSDGAQRSNYFPSTLGSFWIYEDQDGNELTRHAIEGEEIAGKTYPAFSYEPELEDWAEYNPFIRPSLFNRSDAGIKLIVKDEVEKAVKARLKKEMDILVKGMKEQVPPEVGIPPDFDLNVDIEVKGKEIFFLLPETVENNEEWDVNQIAANVKLTFEGEGIPAGEQAAMNFTIIETGIVLGTEVVETASAGKFEDCLKVEYRTETTAVFTPDDADGMDPPGETVTTVWFAPNVGIVKLHQKSGHTFLDMFPDDSSYVFPLKKEKTFELKKYEIKSEEPENEVSN